MRLLDWCSLRPARVDQQDWVILGQRQHPLGTSLQCLSDELASRVLQWLQGLGTLSLPEIQNACALVVDCKLRTQLA